jgi:hypothetical protein
VYEQDADNRRDALAEQRKRSSVFEEFFHSFTILLTLRPEMQARQDFFFRFSHSSMNNATVAGP